MLSTALHHQVATHPIIAFSGYGPKTPPNVRRRPFIPACTLVAVAGIAMALQSKSSNRPDRVLIEPTQEGIRITSRSPNGDKVVINKKRGDGSVIRGFPFALDFTTPRKQDIRVAPAFFKTPDRMVIVLGTGDAFVTEFGDKMGFGTVTLGKRTYDGFGYPLKDPKVVCILDQSEKK